MNEFAIVISFIVGGFFMGLVLSYGEFKTRKKIFKQLTILELEHWDKWEKEGDMHEQGLSDGISDCMDILEEVFDWRE